MNSVRLLFCLLTFSDDELQENGNVRAALSTNGVIEVLF